ncbi:hypothetical protein [Achromobacter denitrificans]|uniref:hypothetical protein n=1 Tax=Achromobacter denitrificans TaxID=32002 RepID=UPI003B9C3AE4
MAYTPGDVPAQYSGLFIQQELEKIREALSGPQPFAFLDKQAVAPAKPREGMIVLAWGAPYWNPGAGAGYYGYVGGSWTKL